MLKPGRPKGLAMRLILITAVLVAPALACSAPVPSPPAPTAAALAPASAGVSIDNGTSIAVTVWVNGIRIADVQPGASLSPVSAALPERPWSVEARASSGTLLAAFVVGADTAISSQAGIGDVAFLACGELVVWVGAAMPDAPRPSGSLKPCE